MNERLEGLAAVRKLSFAGDRSTFALLLAPCALSEAHQLQEAARDPGSLRQQRSGREQKEPNSCNS